MFQAALVNETVHNTNIELEMPLFSRNKPNSVASVEYEPGNIQSIRDALSKVRIKLRGAPKKVFLRPSNQTDFGDTKTVPKNVAQKILETKLLEALPVSYQKLYERLLETPRRKKWDDNKFTDSKILWSLSFAAEQGVGTEGITTAMELYDWGLKDTAWLTRRTDPQPQTVPEIVPVVHKGILQSTRPNGPKQN